MANQTATAAAAFIESLGVNTHLDFSGGPYGNVSAVVSALNYLGLPNVRDAAGAGDIALWQQVAQATGVRFDDFVGQIPPSLYGSALDAMRQLADRGLLNAVEGANEPDTAYPASIGETVGAAVGLQQSVWQLGQQTGLPVINTSFGYIGDYGSTGDLSAWADYGNAHTYFGTGNNPAWAGWIDTLNADARSSAASRPVMVTETGYYTTGNGSDPSNVDETVQAKYTLDLALDTWQAGDARTYFYELLDQGTGNGNPESNFGLFHSDGSAKPAADAIHNLTSLLSDPGGAGIAPGALDYTLSGLQDTDHSMLMQKSDGTFWLAVWNDTRLSGPFNAGETVVPPHQVTLSLGSAASSIEVFDPLHGTGTVQSGSGSSISFDVPDHPVLVEIGGSGGSGTPAAGSPPPAPTPSDGGQQIAAGDALPVLVGDGITASASSGDHMIFLTGTGDTLSATGGTETVQAYLGGNSIVTGAGDDTIRFAGAGNTIDAGGGNNRLEDSGSANTIVLPTAGQGFDDIYGWTMQNGDTFDLRPLLSQAGWNGDPASIGDFVQVTMSGNDAVIGAGSGGSFGTVATLRMAGGTDLAGFLGHAITG